MEQDATDMQYPQDEQPQDIANAGRGTDTVMAHLSLGEIVIPRAFQDDPEVMAALQQIFQAGGADINEFTVGHEANKINPETGYPEFGFFKSLKRFVPIANIGDGWAGVRDSIQSNAVLAGNYLLPGSSMVTSNLVSKGAQENLNSGLGKIANIGSGLAGGGFGQSFTGIPSAGDIGAGWGNLGSALGLGTTAGSPVSGGVGPTQGTGVIGSISRGINSASDSLGSLLGGSGSSSGGGSTFSTAGLLSSALGGFGQDAALKKQREQLLASNQQQLGNLENLNPQDVQNDPGYQFAQQQGEQALNRSLGAQGNVFSGRALQAASEMNQGLASKYYGDAYNRQAGKVGAQNQIYAGTGLTNAQTTGARADNISSSLSRALGGNQGMTLDELRRMGLI